MAYSGITPYMKLPQWSPGDHPKWEDVNKAMRILDGVASPLTIGSIYFASLSALQAAYPSGDSKAYVVAGSGIYKWLDGAWRSIGIDLAGYYNKAEIDALINTINARLLPTGATNGKILGVDASNNPTWQTPTSGLPSGGAIGQVPKKKSAADGDVSWGDANDHAHGNIAATGKIGTDADRFVVTGTGGLIDVKTVQQAASLLGMTNPNILHNWDFRNPVNQRSKSGTISTAQYTLDRWYLSSGSLTINSGNVSLNGVLVQRFEVWALNDKSVTVSVDINGTIYSCTLTPTASSDVTNTVVSGVTLGLYNGATYKEFRITTTSAKTLIRAKVEAGLTSTLAGDPPEDTAIALAKCQRYFINVGNVSLAGYNSSAGNCAFFIPLPVTMRPAASPAVSFIANDFGLLQGGNLYYPPTSVSVGSFRTNGLVMQAAHGSLTYGNTVGVYSNSAVTISVDL